MKRSKIAGIAAVLAAFACTLPNGGSGQPYTPKGNPWESAARDGAGASRTAGAETRGEPKAESSTAAKGEGRGETKGDSKGSGDAPAAGGGTILEQLEAARARVQKLEGENGKLKTDNASLTNVVEQMKKENQNLAQAADTSTQSRARIDQEMEQLRQVVKDTEARARQLADEVLQERILRVRVERELILAKVQEAENAEGG
jgi:predicted RNase H-like nuclease (RuvC/YqgF family)